MRDPNPEKSYKFNSISGPVTLNGLKVDKARYSNGWKCGLHPDWTELTGCVDNYLVGLEGGLIDRKYFYITFLRDSVDRYLSEWRHVKRSYMEKCRAERLKSKLGKYSH